MIQASAKNSKYVIVTPARNEQDFIECTIKSVISQTIRPQRWVIVNDASTDSTREIVESYQKKHNFIHLINLERGGDRNFGRKAIAFARGVVEVQNLDYEFIGNLDADILLEPEYYCHILREFDAEPRLGIGGGIVFTRIGTHFSTTDRATDSVAGAVQMFRRSCFEAVGVYTPLKYGGIDAAAEIKARMLGWKVRKFPEYKVFEQRRTGSARARPFGAKVQEGRRFYSLGYGTLFYLIRCIYRIKDPPFMVGSIAALYGFMESLIRRQRILLSPDLVAYLRKEQRLRLKRLLAELFSIKLHL